MADIKQTLNELLTSFADNNSQNITPNDIRNFVKSVYGNENIIDISTDTTIDSENTVITLSPLNNTLIITIPGSNSNDLQGSTYKGKVFSFINLSVFDVSLTSTNGFSKTLKTNDLISIISNGTNWIVKESSNIDISTNKLDKVQAAAQSVLSEVELKQGLNITAAQTGGSAIKIPDGSWIMPQSSAASIFLTNGLNPGTTNSTLALSNGSTQITAGDGTTQFVSLELSETNIRFLHNSNNVLDITPTETTLYSPTQVAVAAFQVQGTSNWNYLNTKFTAGIDVIASQTGGAAIKIPNGSWIQGQAAGDSIYLTNGTNPGTSNSTLHLTNTGSQLTGGDGTNQFGNFEQNTGSTSLNRIAGAIYIQAGTVSGGSGIALDDQLGLSILATDVNTSDVFGSFSLNLQGAKLNNGRGSVLDILPDQTLLSSVGTSGTLIEATNGLLELKGDSGIKLDDTVTLSSIASETPIKTLGRNSSNEIIEFDNVDASTKLDKVASAPQSVVSEVTFNGGIDVAGALSSGNDIDITNGGKIGGSAHSNYFELNSGYAGLQSGASYVRTSNSVVSLGRATGSNEITISSTYMNFNTLGSMSLESDTSVSFDAPKYIFNSVPTALPSFIYGEDGSGDMAKTAYVDPSSLTLQDVCDNGSTTTTGATFGGAVDVDGQSNASQLRIGGWQNTRNKSAFEVNAFTDGNLYVGFKSALTKNTVLWCGSGLNYPSQITWGNLDNGTGILSLTKTFKALDRIIQGNVTDDNSTGIIAESLKVEGTGTFEDIVKAPTYSVTGGAYTHFIQVTGGTGEHLEIASGKDLVFWSNRADNANRKLFVFKNNGDIVTEGGATFEGAVDITPTSTSQYALYLRQSPNASAIHMSSVGDGYMGWIGTRANNTRRFAFESSPSGSGSNFGLYLYDSSGVNVETSFITARGQDFEFVKDVKIPRILQGGVTDDNTTGILGTSAKFTGDILLDRRGQGVDSKIIVRADDTNEAFIGAYTNAQGTGKIFAGQSLAFGGGISYNGSSDFIEFFRKRNSIESWIFRVDVDSDSIEFKSNVTVGERIIQGGVADDGSTGILGTSAKFTNNVDASSFSLSALNTAPSSATDTGTTGEVRYTSDYIYTCVATNTWKRSALTTW